MRTIAWFLRQTADQGLTWTSQVLPDNDDDYVPNENSSSTHSSEHWSAAPTSSSGARAMYWRAAYWREDRRCDFWDVPHHAGTVHIADSPVYTIIGKPSDLYELWDPLAEGRDQHPEFGQLWWKPSKLRQFLWFLVLMCRPRWVLSLFFKTPEERMTTHPWYCYPKIDRVRDINLPPDNTWVHVRLSPNLRWGIGARGVIGKNFKVRKDGSLDLKAVKRAFGLDNFRVVDRAHGRFHIPRNPNVLSKLSLAVLAGSEERLGPERYEDEPEHNPDTEPIVLRVCEYHTPWSWAWRLVRNKVRWMARVLIVFGAAVYAVLRAVLAGYRWFVALGLPGIVSASLVLAILLFCDWLLPKVASQVLTQEEVDRVEQESAQ